MPKPKIDPTQLSPAAREAFDLAKRKAAEGDDYELRAFAALRDYPVDVEEFTTSPDYLGSDALYPAVMEAIVELNNPAIDDCEYRARLVRRQRFSDSLTLRIRECLAPWFDVKRPWLGDANAVCFPWSHV